MPATAINSRFNEANPARIARFAVTMAAER